MTSGAFRRVWPVAPVAAMLALACTTPQDFLNSNGYIDFLVSGSSASVTPGGTVAISVAVNRQNGFNGPVTVTATGLPLGVTAGPITIPAGSNSGTLVIAATSVAVTGTSTVTLQASGAGINTKSQTLTLTVLQPAGFTMSLNPSTVGVQEGGTATVGVSFVRAGGFTGPISLSASNLPPGLTVAADSPAYNGSSATLDFSAEPNFPTGAFSMIITGQSTGVVPQTAPLGVQLLPPPAGTRTSFTFCGQLPSAVAVQDGTGPFVLLTSSNNTFTFNITRNFGAIAAVTGNATAGFQTSVIEATAQELATLGQPSGQCASTTAGKTISGIVRGLGPTDVGEVIIDRFSVTVPGPDSLWTLAIPPSPRSIVWGGYLLATRASGPKRVINRVVVLRGLGLDTVSTPPPLDFNSSAAFAPANALITITGLGSDQATTSPSLYTANGNLLSYGGGTQPGAASSVTIQVLPQTQLVSGDLTQVQVTTTTSSSSVRIGGGFFLNPNGATIDLGPPLATPTLSTLATTPNARVRLTSAMPSAYTSSWSASFSQPGHAITIFMTPGYAAGASTLSFDTPDFSGLPGWSGYGLTAGVSTASTFTANNFHAPNPALRPLPSNGSTYSIVQYYLAAYRP